MPDSSSQSADPQPGAPPFRVRYYSFQGLRIFIATFVAATGGVLASSLIPCLLFHLPLALLLFPSRPFLLLILMFALLIGMPFFLVISTQRRMSVWVYVSYGMTLAVMAMLFLAFNPLSAAAFAPTRLFDVAWIILTEALPGGVAAGLAAHLTMTVGMQYQIAGKFS